jgi:hypothetical protein
MKPIYSKMNFFFFYLEDYKVSVKMWKRTGKSFGELLLELYWKYPTGCMK